MIIIIVKKKKKNSANFVSLKDFTTIFQREATCAVRFASLVFETF